MANKLRVITYEIDVPAAATPVSIKQSGGSDKATEIWLQAKSTNAADNMLVGAIGGQFFPVLKASPTKLEQLLNRQSAPYDYDLNDILVKAGTNGDDVLVMIMVKDEL